MSRNLNILKSKSKGESNSKITLFVFDQISHFQQKTSGWNIHSGSAFVLKMNTNKTVQGQCATPCTNLVNPYDYETINHVYSV